MEQNGMSRSGIIVYLEEELRSAHKAYVKLRNQYDNAGQTDRAELIAGLIEAENRYCYVWMLCNDIGVDISTVAHE